MGMSIEQAMFMAEAENRFPKEREESIEGAIEDFQLIKEHGFDPNDYIDDILASHHLSNLSKAEINRINSEVDAYRC